MLTLLNGVYIPLKSQWHWPKGNDGTSVGESSIASLFLMISGGSSNRSFLARLWYVPPRVAAFGCVAMLGKILTTDYLWRHKKNMVNGCLMCLAEEKSVDHLFLNCKVARRLWRSILGMVWLHLDSSKQVGYLIEAWSMAMGSTC